MRKTVESLAPLMGGSRRSAELNMISIIQALQKVNGVNDFGEFKGTNGDFIPGSDVLSQLHRATISMDKLPHEEEFLNLCKVAGVHESSFLNQETKKKFRSIKTVNMNYRPSSSPLAVDPIDTIPLSEPTLEDGPNRALTPPPSVPTEDRPKKRGRPKKSVPRTESDAVSDKDPPLIDNSEQEAEKDDEIVVVRERKDDDGINSEDIITEQNETDVASARDSVEADIPTSSRKRRNDDEWTWVVGKKRKESEEQNEDKNVQARRVLRSWSIPRLTFRK